MRSSAVFSASAAIALLLGGPVLANQVGTTTPIQRLRIDVHARIPARCGFADAPKSPTGTPDINIPQHLDIPFQLDCNTPFIIGVKSDHGALASDRTPDNSGFAFTKPYWVKLDVGTDGPTLRPHACASDALTDLGGPNKGCEFFGDKPGEGLSSYGLISAHRPSHLTVGWDGANDSARNVAGAYQDTITITVTART